MNNEEKQPLRIVNGQFMRGSEVVAPEIGNREQIALLQSIERKAVEREKQAKAGTMNILTYAQNIHYTAVCEFTCLCGSRVLEEAPLCSIDGNAFFDSIDTSEDFDIVKCPTCKREYRIIGDNKAKLL